MGIVGELAREQRDRTSAPAAVPVEQLVPVEGQLFRDGINPGYGWVVSRVDDEFVWLNMIDPRGEVTTSYLQWARNRWPVLAERHGLELVVDD